MNFCDGRFHGGSAGETVYDGQFANFNWRESPSSVVWADSPFVCARPNETCDAKGVKRSVQINRTPGGPFPPFRNNA